MHTLPIIEIPRSLINHGRFCVMAVIGKFRLEYVTCDSDITDSFFPPTTSIMASGKPNKLAFLSMPAPASYVAGLGRGYVFRNFSNEFFLTPFQCFWIYHPFRYRSCKGRSLGRGHRVRKLLFFYNYFIPYSNFSIQGGSSKAR